VQHKSSYVLYGPRLREIAKFWQLEKDYHSTTPAVVGFPDDNPFWARLNRRGISRHIKWYFRRIFAARRDIREAALSKVYQTFAAADSKQLRWQKKRQLLRQQIGKAPVAPPAKKKTKK
jgi:hypothetical protein